MALVTTCSYSITDRQTDTHIALPLQQMISRLREFTLQYNVQCDGNNPKTSEIK